MRCRTSWPARGAARSRPPGHSAPRGAIRRSRCTCGVSLPADFDKFATCEEADGVGWFVPQDQSEDQSSDVTFTAAGYRPIVEVRLPASYRPEGAAAVIAELAGPVKDTLRLVNRCD